MSNVFLISLVVSLATIFFTGWQTNAYEKLYEKRIAKADSDENKFSFHYGLHPDFVRRWFFQGFDLATNFPTAVLTLVAYSDLLHGLAVATWVYIIVSLAILAIFLWVGNPKRSIAYENWTIKGVSYMSISLAIANVVGLLVSLHVGTNEPIPVNQ